MLIAPPGKSCSENLHSSLLLGHRGWVRADEEVDLVGGKGGDEEG